jgi:RNA polymerase sigma-70 factor (ECF subfamily)
MTDDDYEVFFRSTYPKLVGYGASMSAPLGIAQELAQETLLRAYRRLDEVSALESPYGWCRRVMSNLLIDQYRSRTAERAAVNRLASISAIDRVDMGTSDPESSVANDRWFEIVDSLTMRQRCIATLYYADDLSVADVAAELAISTGSVKSTLSQVRRRLERLLDETTKHEEACHGN